MPLQYGCRSFSIASRVIIRHININQLFVAVAVGRPAYVFNPLACGIHVLRSFVGRRLNDSAAGPSVGHDSVALDHSA